MSKCTDCEEYNQEKHYCPTFCEVIRNTCKENKEYYIELLQDMRQELVDKGLYLYSQKDLEIIDKYIEKAKETNNDKNNL